MTRYQKSLEAIELLSPLQRKVTQEGHTEPAFDNVYWKHNLPGIYVDVVSGEPLFSSLEKFDTSCGWPSFTKPVASENINPKVDTSYGMNRIEVRSRHSDSHLGHVFDDGPPEVGGLRYCINSASLRFVPVDALEREGYGEFLSMFQSV